MLFKRTSFIPFSISSSMAFIMLHCCPLPPCFWSVGHTGAFNWVNYAFPLCSSLTHLVWVCFNWFPFYAGVFSHCRFVLGGSFVWSWSLCFQVSLLVCSSVLWLFVPPEVCVQFVCRQWLYCCFGSRYLVNFCCSFSASFSTFCVKKKKLYLNTFFDFIVLTWTVNMDKYFHFLFFLICTHPSQGVVFFISQNINSLISKPVNIFAFDTSLFHKNSII